MKGIARELALCAAGLILGLALCEAVLPVFNPQPLMSSAYEDRNGMRVFKPNAVIKHRYSPHYDVVYHTNALGFRGPIYGPAIAPDVYRVVVLGPSFSFGIGVGDEKTYSRVLERRLNAEGKQTRFEVMNFGWPGIRINAYLPFYRDVIARYSPHLLLVHLNLNSLDPHQIEPLKVFVGTDATSSSQAVTVRRWLRRLRSVPGYSFLCENSHLWALLRLHMAHNIDQMGAQQLRRGQPSEKADADDPPLEKKWIDMFDSFVAAVCGGRRDLRVLVTRDTHDMTNLPGLVDYLRRKSAAEPCFKFVEVDLEPQRYTMVGEGHWNPAGHALISNAVFDALTPRLTTIR